MSADEPKRPALEIAAEDLQRLISHVPHARAVGLRVEGAAPDRAWLRVAWREDLVGNPETGVLHGGVITTMLDNAAGIAVMAALEELRSIATLDLRIEYLKPATPHRDVIGAAHCHRVGRNIAFVRGVAYHEREDDPIATMTAAFMLGANPGPPPLAMRTPETDA